MLLDSFMGPVVHGHRFCSNLVVYHCIGSLHTAENETEDVKEDLKGGKERVLEMFEDEDQALSYIERSEMYSRNPL